MQIIVDANSVCHRMKHTMGELSYAEKKVGILWGFLRQILTIGKKFDTNDFIFCWDSKSRKRTEISSVYKANRHKEMTEEEREMNDLSYAQFDELRTVILPKLGFKNNFMVEGYEADDLVARVVKDYNTRRWVIISTDNDLFQLLTPHVSLMLDIKKPLYKINDFRDNYELMPDQWPFVKAIAGCPGDNVIGLDGVGIKTACKYLRHELARSTRAYQAIADAEDNLIQLNLRLVHLPYDGLEHLPLQCDDLSLDGFLEVATKYQFNSFLNRDNLKVWRKVIF